MKEIIDLARGWMQKADNDLQGARVLLSAGGPFDAASFHCQQAAEKYLKGFLVAHGKSFPFTHSIEDLAKLCEAIDGSLELE